MVAALPGFGACPARLVRLGRRCGVVGRRQRGGDHRCAAVRRTGRWIRLGAQWRDGRCALRAPPPAPAARSNLRRKPVAARTRRRGGAEAITRSTDGRNRPLTWRALVRVWSPGCAESDAACVVLGKERRNTTIPIERLPRRWPRTAIVIRLEPTGEVTEEPGAMETASGAVPPPESSARTTAGCRGYPAGALAAVDRCPSAIPVRLPDSAGQGSGQPVSSRSSVGW